MYYGSGDKPFSDLIGKTLVKVEIIENSEIVFTTDSGDAYKMFHDQDCCEHVDIESIVGDIDDLIGNPILMAEEATGETAQPECWTPEEYEESYTWTFYKLATVKGYVDIRWYGSSNGYYSESVSFVLI